MVAENDALRHNHDVVRTMSKGAKVTLFSLLVIVGVLSQTPLSIHCRCPWGEWSQQFIQGALVFNVLWIGRTIIAIHRGKFFADWLWVGLLVFTSSIWIPLLYKAWTSVILLATEGRIGDLGH